jgi:hypothetical protein
VLSIVIWELWENGQYVELSALGVLMMLALFTLTMVAQRVGGLFGARYVKPSRTSALHPPREPGPPSARRC